MRVIDQGEDVYSEMLYTRQPQEESIYTTTGPQDKRSLVVSIVPDLASWNSHRFFTFSLVK